MAAAGAADGDGQRQLPLLQIQGQQEIQHVLQLFQEGPGLLVAEHKLRHWPVQPAHGPKLVHIEGVGEEPGVKHQVRVHGDAVLVAEGHDRYGDFPLVSLPGKQVEKLVLQHTQGQTGGVHDIIRPRPHRGQQLRLLRHGLLHGYAGGRHGVGPAGLLVAADKGAGVRVHIQDAASDVHPAQLVQGGQKLAEAVLFPHIRHQRHLFIAPSGGDAQLREAGHQRHGHIVHAVILQVLQHIRRPALACAGKAGDDQKFHVSLSLIPPAGSPR